MNSHQDKIPFMLIILAIVAALVCFNSNKSVEDELAAAQNDKAILDQQLERYSDIDQHYGRASDDFYSDKPIIVLRGSGATDVIPIYWVKNKDVPITAHYNSDILELSWGENNDKIAKLNVKSKVAKGYNALRFTNEDNSGEFSVLVIVK